MPKYLADGTSSKGYGHGECTGTSPLISFMLYAGHYNLQGATPTPISPASSDLLEVFHSRPLRFQLGTQLCHLQTDGLGGAWCTEASVGLIWGSIWFDEIFTLVHSVFRERGLRVEKTDWNFVFKMLAFSEGSSASFPSFLRGATPYASCFWC